VAHIELEANVQEEETNRDIVSEVRTRTVSKLGPFLGSWSVMPQ
jgi:hypothetical protein